MAATLITAQTILSSGLEATLEAGATTMEFVNTGQEEFWIVNGATAAVVTVTGQTACDRGTIHNKIVTCPANEERKIGPFPKGRWNDANSKVQVAIDDVTNVTVAVLKTPIAS